MTNQEDFDLIIQAIIDAREKQYPQKYNRSYPLFIEFEFTSKNKLNKLSKSGVLTILENFQWKEGIIQLSDSNYPDIIINKKILGHYEYDKGSNKKIFVPLPKLPKAKSSEKIVKKLLKKKPSISLTLTEKFDNWYSAYLVGKGSSLEELSLLNLAKVYNIILDIEEKFQLYPKPDIAIDLFSSYKIQRFLPRSNSEAIEVRTDALNFLKIKNIINYYNIHTDGLNHKSIANINLNVEKFTEFKVEVEKIYKEKNNMESDGKRVASIQFPQDTKWEDITIKFLDGHNVNIILKDKNTPSDYKSMGFENQRSRSPNKQWELLRGLAGLKGELTWKDHEAGITIKKRKELLSKALKSFFGLKEDPFYPYKKEQAYKIKINLIPE